MAPKTSYDFSISGRVFSRKALGTISVYLSTAARYAPTTRCRDSLEAGMDRKFGGRENVPVPYLEKWKLIGTKVRQFLYILTS